MFTRDDSRALRFAMLILGGTADDFDVAELPRHLSDIKFQIYYPLSPPPQARVSRYRMILLGYDCLPPREGLGFRREAASRFDLAATRRYCRSHEGRRRRGGIRRRATLA